MEPSSALMQVIIPQFRMHTQSFDNVLADIKDKDATVRVEDRTNHILWIAGNLVNERFWLANLLGVQDKDPFDDLFKMGKALDTNADYPKLEVLKKEWHTISPLLFKQLLNVSDSELNEAYPFGMGVDFVTENKLNMIGMGIDRESYLLGQLGLMRRVLGYAGMKYDFNKDIKY